MALQELETAMLDIDGSDDALLTVDDAARVLKVPVSWVYEHVRPGSHDRLPVVKLGKYLRFHRRDLQAYIDAKRVESRPAAVDAFCPARSRIGVTRGQGEPLNRRSKWLVEDDRQGRYRSRRRAHEGDLNR